MIAPRFPKIVASLFVASMFVAASTSVFAATIQGPGQITATTNIQTCGPICQGLGADINQIADGDSSDENGFAGLDDALGIIKLDLLGVFDLNSFTLHNDVVDGNEGVETFKLHFFDEADLLISSTDNLVANSQVAGQTYNFAAAITGVGSVDFEVLSLLTGAFGARIEVREVSFNGEETAVSAVPLPAALPLLAGGLGLFGLMGWRRKRKVVASNV